MLRIESNRNGTSEVLTLEGTVVGPWIDELRASFADAFARGGAPVVLDLAGVSFVSRNGVALLRELVERGARLVNASPFVIDQLNDPPS